MNIINDLYKMKSFVIYSGILISLIFTGCRTYDKDGYWTDKSRRTADVAEPALCSQYLLIYETERYQVFACPSAFESRKPLWRQYPTFSDLQNNIKRSEAKDTIVCFKPPDNGQLNEFLFPTLIEDELCWIFDKQTGKYVEHVVIEEWQWGHRDGGLVGGGGITIYVGDELLIIVITSMA